MVNISGFLLMLWEGYAYIESKPDWIRWCACTLTACQKIWYLWRKVTLVNLIYTMSSIL